MTLLTLDNVVVRFGKGFAVGPVSLQMNRGLLHIHGPNGGGKTTLMRAIAGELAPAQGRILIGGLDVQRSIEARRNVALVPAEPELPEFLTVREAYKFAASVRGAPGWNGAGYCAELNLDPRMTLVTGSAGQRGKAELVCGLAGDPGVLLLDETFAHFDAGSSGTLRRWVDEWRATRLVVLTHHGELPLTPDARLELNGNREAGNAGDLARPSAVRGEIRT